MTGVEKISELEGKRVRLVVGDKGKWFDQKEGRMVNTERSVADWIAGEVPVGTVGTIRPFTRIVMQIVWDGIKPKAGYVFGTTDETLKRMEVLT